MEGDRTAVQGPAQYGSGVGASYGNGWRQLWKNFWVLLSILIIYLGISLGIGAAFGIGELVTTRDSAVVWEVLSWATAVLVIWPLSYGFAFAFLKAARGTVPGLNDLFAFTANYWNSILANVLVAAIIFGGFIFFIVPGVLFACKLAFVPYLVVENRMGTYDAIRESWRLTSGYTGKVFLVYMLAIPVFVAGLLCLGVGIFVALMWTTLADASLYHAISSLHKPASKPENATV